MVAAAALLVAVAVVVVVVVVVLLPWLVAWLLLGLARFGAFRDIKNQD